MVEDSRDGSRSLSPPERTAARAARTRTFEAILHGERDFLRSVRNPASDHSPDKVNSLRAPVLLSDHLTTITAVVIYLK